MTDRTKPPKGYEIRTVMDMTDDEDAHTPSLSYREYATEPEAIADCWRHRDRIAAEALREMAEAMRLDMPMGPEPGMDEYSQADAAGVQAAWEDVIDRLMERARELDPGPDRKAEP